MQAPGQLIEVAVSGQLCLMIDGTLGAWLVAGLRLRLPAEPRDGCFHFARIGADHRQPGGAKGRSHVAVGTVGQRQVERIR